MADTQRTTARDFLRNAKRLEARAHTAAGDEAARLQQQARKIRAAAARIAERDAAQRGDELPLT